MPATVVAGRLGGVTEGETRGHAATRRMTALGLNYTTLGREAEGLDRQTVRRALADSPQTDRGTWRRIEDALTRLEADTGLAGGPDAVMSTTEGLVEFEVTGDFGVRVVVKGPIGQTDELERSVARLIRDIRADDSRKLPPADTSRS